MSLIRSGVSALGKLLFIALLGLFFVAGMGAVVYKSLQGDEIKVPEIVGKNFSETETELAGLGLKIKRRADRYSTEAPNTILEQLPRPGETVKTGQMILVVISKQSADGSEAPATLNKNTNEQDDTEKIEEMISDKPKKTNKTNANTNTKKKTRDVAGNTSASNVGSSSSENSNKKDSGTADGDKANKKPDTPGPGKNDPKPTGGDVRPRTTPKP